MKHHETLEHSLVLDVETSAFDAEISVLGAETSVLTWSFRWYLLGVSGDCSVGITPQMCNIVTNHGDMGIFSRPVASHSMIVIYLINKVGAQLNT